MPSCIFGSSFFFPHNGEVVAARPCQTHGFAVVEGNLSGGVCSTGERRIEKMYLPLPKALRHELGEFAGMDGPIQPGVPNQLPKAAGKAIAGKR